jgi:cycloeucalenol cycloisomerase
VFILKVSACWIASVAVVIGLSAYEWWGEWGYMAYCVTCASPYVLVPLFAPLEGDVVRGKGPRRGSVTVTAKPLREAYIFKANLWIAVFSFIGNYWYTHYFYGVLNARYTFDAHRLNDVPIALYFMTHAYFMFYHVLSNCALRKTRRAFAKDARRFAFECALVVVMAYTTAFMESLTICGFPYYSFEDRDMAYTLGSAFYGIYFLVSFPMFLAVDESPATKKTHAETFWEAMGSSMAVLCLLDFVRLRLGLDFVMRVR